MTQSFTKQYINGSWTEGSSAKTIENANPFTQEALGTITSANEQDLDAAYNAAATAQKEWAALVPAERQAHLYQLADTMQEEKEFIKEWLVKEAGSTAAKAEAEFQAALGIVRESASFPTRMDGKILPSNNPGKENYVYRMPKGVVGVIGPWNFPFHLSMRSIAPALATGNTVVIKPASDTPVTSGLMLAHVFEKAGFPKGTVNVLVGRGSEIGDSFVTHPVPKVISFTGSTEVGSHIAELAGKHLKETALELGGNNVMLVLEDADVDQAVEAAAFGKFLHQGQICMALNRIVVHESIHDEFAEKFIAKTKSLQAGDPSDQKTIIGPLINKDQLDRIQKDLDESVKQGAHIALDGKTNGNLLEPVVLTGVTNDMPIAENEIFGPVAPIIKVSSEQEAIDIANASPYGLSGSVFTKDRFRGIQVAKQIETGMVHINDQSVNDEAHVAFGGEKDSGLGRFGGEWVIDKFTTVKTIGVQSGYRKFPF
ncbi:aldehyde dehydrogenase family protein [Sinobaca sp. H24]|uniref:aldehyde dehydrogenase family protein n=1 Tax=Sinobaca sp. H24 TaxID=2923376 RepID=UPI00207ACA0E|nr:aldehyde dehydrogenase family protein [Sinobaca sp. H24]